MAEDLPLAEAERSRVGLCADCSHVRRIESLRESRFYLCGRSLVDPAFPRYPRLPVIRCAGYEPRHAAVGVRGDSS